MLISSIQPIDKTLSDATTMGQSGPESDSNKGVLCISQSSSIIGTSPLDYLVSYLGYLLGEAYSFCQDAVGVFYNPNQLSHPSKENATIGQYNFYNKIIRQCISIIKSLDIPYYVLVRFLCLMAYQPLWVIWC